MFSRPDSSSISSSSDFEASFHSEKAKEEDLDMQLEGISLLLGDPDSLEDNNQKAMLQRDN